MDANDIKNLVFFAIAIAAWGTQALLKRNQEAQAQRQRNEARRASRDDGATPEAAASPRSGFRAETGSEDLPDVVFGRRPLPPRYTSPAPPAQARPHTPPPPLPPARPSGGPPVVARQLTEGGASDLGSFRDHHLQSRFVTTEAATVRRDQSGTNARRRLQIRTAGGQRTALRTAVLWSEILGSPRAYRGPHRWKSTRER